MINILNKIMLEIPNDWQVISKEDYPLRKVYISDAYQIVGAYDVDGELVVINHYPEVEGFVEAYDEQFKDVKKILKDKKSWKDVSVINPIKNTYLKNEENEKIYLSVFETYNNEEKVSVQIFYEDKENIIGVSTFVDKEENKDILDVVKTNKTIKTLLGFFKTTKKQD